MNDRELITNIQKGAIDDYAPLIKRHQYKLHSALLPYCSDPVDLNHFLHEAFVHAYQQLSKFDAERPFFPWLKKIALNLLRDEMRSRGTHSTRLTNFLLEQVQNESLQGSLSEDMLDSMRHCHAQLENGLQEMIKDHYYEKMLLAQIAVKQGKKLGTVKVQLQRAREALRKCIKLQLGSHS